jgi:hypothetical protein
MKSILDFIEKKKQEFSQLPLFQFMRDESIDPRQRLSWAPWIAPFVMSFGDLNKHIFRQEPATDKIQELINIHSYEDDHHWLWFLEDLEKLGFNPSLKYSDALRLMWGKRTEKSRLICNELGLLYKSQTDMHLKLGIIEAIEAAGHVNFFLVSEVSKQLQPITKVNYRYFSPSHFAVETGHSIGIENFEDVIVRVELTEETRQQAFVLVEQVFELFTEMVQELMENITSPASNLPSLDSYSKESHSKPLDSHLPEAVLVHS